MASGRSARSRPLLRPRLSSGHFLPSTLDYVAHDRQTAAITNSHGDQNCRCFSRGYSRQVSERDLKTRDMVMAAHHPRSSPALERPQRTPATALNTTPRARPEGDGANDGCLGESRRAPDVAGRRTEPHLATTRSRANQVTADTTSTPVLSSSRIDEAVDGSKRATPRLANLGNDCEPELPQERKVAALALDFRAAHGHGLDAERV